MSTVIKSRRAAFVSAVAVATLCFAARSHIELIRVP